jgi:hypothetical protein
MDADKYIITADEARRRLEARYREQAVAYPLTLLISMPRYVRANIKHVRKHNLLTTYAEDTDGHNQAKS